MPDSYTILFFAASYFTFFPRHLINQTSYLLWPRHFIHSRAIGDSPPLFHSSILDTFRPGGLIFWCHTFLAFYVVHEVLMASYTGVVCYSLLQWITFSQNSPQWPQDWKRSILIPIPKKSSTKECANCQTLALISHASEVILKILHARLQHYANQELADVQAGFRKGK